MTKCFSRRLRRRWLRQRSDRTSRKSVRSGQLVEPLEFRMLMAADLQLPLGPVGDTTAFVAANPQAVQSAEGESAVAEGESAAIYTIDDFAKALKDSGVRFYGASWCTLCGRQKGMFGGSTNLPYIETTDAIANGTDTTLNPTGRPITNLPTWEFQDLTRVTGVLTLQQISEYSGIPMPANVVTINTNKVDFDIELLKSDAPITVANFLKYVNDGDYNNSFMHRYVSGFVLQGGGFKTSSPTYTNTSQFTAVPTDAAIQNEYKLSNTANTLAMAKLGGDPNSATSQFFINLADNSSNLDSQNGGFTVFARVLDSGIVALLTSNLTTVNAGGAYTALPTFDSSQLVTINSIEGSGTVRGTVFTDTNANGTKDSGESALSNLIVYSDANNNGLRDGDELYVTTGADGSYAIVLPSGGQKIRAVLPAGNVQSVPSGGDGYVVTLAVGGDLTGRDFGMAPIAAPTGLNLADATDSGFSPTDNLTNFNNSAADKKLQFRVGGIQSGATVRIYADGNLIGEGTGSGEVLVTTNGTTALIDGSHSITAVQVVNGLPGGASSTLTISVDTTTSAFTSTPPTQAKVGTALTYNADNPEDSVTGSAYSLLNAPSGATINATSGAFSWTPTESQVGSHTFSIVFTDAAGNTRTQPMNVTVSKEVMVQLRMEVTDVSGNPVSQVHVGDTFQLRGYVKDVRPSATGVFSFYEDVTYNGALATPTANAITFGTQYGNGRAGDTATAGLLDEIGSFAGSLSGLGSTEYLFYTVTFVAQKAGTLTFTGDAPDVSPFHDIGVYDSNDAIPLDRIAYGQASVNVAAAFGVANDTYSFDEDTVANVMNVLANDVSLNGANLTISSVATPPSGGTATVSADGKTILYTPKTNYFGVDTFTYQATDGNDTLTATATVQVHPVNDNPTGVNDSMTVAEDSSNNVLDVLANDLITPDASETLEVVSVSTPSRGGVATRGTSGLNIVYTPPANATGTETFTYTLSDKNGGTSTATVTVTLTAVNDPPTAVSDSFTVAEDSNTTSFDVVQNDSSQPDGTETLSVTAVGTPNHGGTVSLGADGKVNYKPAANYFGQETFTYTLSDGNGGTATGSVSVTVTPTNDPPTATADSLTVTKNTSNNSLDVLANDSILPDTGETLVITLVGTSTKGVVPTISADGKRVLYTPTAGYTGTDSFTYTISDGNGGTAQGTATINVVEYVPSSLAGFVYYDSDNDGVKDSGETGAGGVTITLTGTDYTGAAVSRQATTGTDGSYSFTQLAPGSYKLKETQPTAPVNNVPVVDGKDTIGSQGGSVSANDEFTITLAEGTNGTGNNFAELLGRSIAGVVTNANTTTEQGSLAYGGFGVQLYAADSSGKATGSALSHATSDADGNFSFPGLSPQQYIVVPDAQPFLRSGGSTAAISLSSADSTNNVVPGRGLKAKYVSYRFFMNSTSSQEFAYTATGTTANSTKWYTTHGTWANYTNVATQYSATQKTLSIEVTETGGTKRTASVSIDDPRVDYIGQEGTSHLFRLNGPASAFNLQAVAAQSASGEGESAASTSAAANIPAMDAYSTAIENAIPVDAIGTIGEGEAPALETSQLVLPTASLWQFDSAEGEAVEDNASDESRTVAVDEIMAESWTAPTVSGWDNSTDPTEHSETGGTDAALDEIFSESSLLEWI
jgi:cyclophilin family peptidyl-prolyl cis-trans isomerase